MDETSGRQEDETQPEEETWKWEVVENPADRLHLIATTIQECILQHVTAAAGYAEMAGSEHPKFTQNAKECANLAKESTLSVGRMLRAIQRVIRLDPTQPLPIDRITYANEAFIILDKVPDSDIKPPLPNSPK